MGRGSVAKKASRIRTDVRRAGLGLAPKYSVDGTRLGSAYSSSAPAWINSLNGYLASELNLGTGFKWLKDQNYVSYSADGITIDCGYTPVKVRLKGREFYEKEGVKLHVAVRTKKEWTEEQVRAALPGTLEVNVVKFSGEGGDTIIQLRKRVSRPKYQRESQEAKEYVHSVVVPLLTLLGLRQSK